MSDFVVFELIVLSQRVDLKRFVHDYHALLNAPFNALNSVNKKFLRYNVRFLLNFLVKSIVFHLRLYLKA